MGEKENRTTRVIHRELRAAESEREREKDGERERDREEEAEAEGERERERERERGYFRLLHVKKTAPLIGSVD